jgi:Tfp pilus assembly protein PilX
MKTAHAFMPDTAPTSVPIRRSIGQAISTTMAPLGVWLARDDGIATAVGLLVVATLTLLGMTGIMITATDLKIGGAYKTSEGAFYAAEAGLEEARGRLSGGAGANLIADTLPTSTQWRAYLGSLPLATAKGFVAGTSTQLRVDSLQPTLSYVVTLRHQTNGAGQILYWGDDQGIGVNRRNPTTGRNIYLATSTGDVGQAQRTVEAELAGLPPITIPGALYVEATTTVQGNSTYISGVDACGTDHQPGVRTTLGAGSVTQNGGPTILGGGTNPAIAYGSTNLDVQTIVDTLKSYATHAYAVASATRTGMNWGVPTPGATLQSPSACTVQNIVHYQTSETYISLTGGSSGCGILLVEGDLNIHGGFSWYGPVVVTGSVTFTGGGNKQVTGAVLAGGTVDAELVGGNTNLVYCSPAAKNQTQNLPLKVLSWREP